MAKKKSNQKVEEHEAEESDFALYTCNKEREEAQIK